MPLEMGLVFVRGQNPSRQYVSEVDLNAVSSQTYFEATLPLKVGHRAKGKKGKINKYLKQLLPPY